MKDSLIIITNNSNKKSILRKLSLNKLLYNIKFMSFNDLKKKLFFDYNNEAIMYIMENYNVNINIAEIYINNLYFLKDIANHKIKFLLKLKKELESKNLLLRSPEFKDYLRHKKIIIYGFDELTKEEQLIINEISSSLEYKQEVEHHYEPLIYKAKNINEEVEFVVNKISELIKKGIEIKKIKIIINDDYRNTINRYFHLYNIPLNLPNSSSLYSTFIAQEFLTQYNNYSIEKNIAILSENKNNLNELINVINKSVLVTNKNLRREFIERDLKNSKIKSLKYDNAVEICNLETIFSEDEYVFLLGFNINFYPKILKDEDYLPDYIKEKLGLDTSSSLNHYAKNKIKRNISNIKNLTITYKTLNSNGSVCYPSTLIQEMGFEPLPATINREKSYSKLASELEYAKSLDNLIKFNIQDENLGLYKNSLNIAYREYNNAFNGINLNLFKESLNHELTLAYTNLEMYNECAFKYYLSKILKIDKYEINFKTIIGNITHHILEIGLKKELNISHEIMLFAKEQNYELTNREYFYLEKLSSELKRVLEIIKEQNKHSELNDYMFESELYIYKDREDIKITFKGTIDKVMKKEIDNTEILAIVDYKTGNTFITLDNLKYGLNIQLPIYLYLLKKSSQFQNAKIAGFYIQKVLTNLPLIEPNKSLLDIQKESLKLQGYSNSNPDILKLIDNEYQNSKIIKDLKYKNNGDLYSNSKVLSDLEMEELAVKVDEKIEECIENILNAEFNINPKVIKNNNISCTYCKFKDICFKTKKDEIILEEGEEVGLDS